MAWTGRLLRGALRLSAALSLVSAHRLGALGGYLAWLTPNAARRVAARNLKLCFADAPSATQRRLLRQNLIESGKALLELGPLWLWRGERVLGLVRDVRGEADLQAALREGRGAILLAPHLGAWELAGLYFGNRYPLTALYRPSRLGTTVDEFVRQYRERTGARLVAADGQGVRRLLRALQAGEVIGILPDQNPSAGEGLFAPFFGICAYTQVLLSRLAMRSGAAVFTVYAERLPRAGGFRLHLTRVPQAINQGPLQASVTAVNTAVEQAVRRLPNQYLWSYKRFKKRPSGAHKLY